MVSVTTYKAVFILGFVKANMHGLALNWQCGQGSTDDEMSPCHVATLVGLPVSGVAAGLWHTLCITDSGDVYACGGNQFGQLGVGGDHAEMLPRLVESPILEDETMISVASGARHSAVLTETGKMFSWGWNKYGQLGLGDSSDRDLPVQVAITDADYVSSIACGWWHTLAVVYSK
jgi:alpha-tubulin suppressor-like RCC1 family protein